MLLELYGIEETVRGRRERIASDMRAFQQHDAGRLRRLIGGALITIGESIRGRCLPEPVAAATTQQA